MTELEQLETDTYFASLKKMLDKAGSLDAIERMFRNRGGLTANQARLFAKYYQKKDELQKKLSTRVKQAPRIAAQIRYNKPHPGHKIGKMRNGRVFIRNTKGRFAKVPRYIKLAFKTGARSKK